MRFQRVGSLVLCFGLTSLLVGCGHGSSLELLEIQLEGKKRTSARDFLHGHRPAPGEKLG